MDEDADDRTGIIAEGSRDAILDAMWRLAADLGDGSIPSEMWSRLEMIRQMVENALGPNKGGIRRFATSGPTST